jgi:hypothetical protein
LGIHKISAAGRKRKAKINNPTNVLIPTSSKCNGITAAAEKRKMAKDKKS